MKTKLTFALVALMTSTAFAAFQAPLPEFKNEKQLAEWRAEKASEATSRGYVTEEAAFYTGKPYLASSGGYAFRYRSYNPEVARWTSEDPSGFPDGANNQLYAPSPTYGFDPDGLKAHLAFENQIHQINLTVYVYDYTGANFTQQGSMTRWKNAVESAWTFQGTDKSNGQALSMVTTISFQLQSGGTLNETAILNSYDNLVKFTAATNLPSTVNNLHNVGTFQLSISDQVVVHEVGHFMMGADKYTETFPNGVRTTTVNEGWGNTIMGSMALKASKLDANHILEELGVKIHLFE